MLTVGLSGATCSGKTSLASLLEKVFPRVSVVNLDKYYYEEDSPHHVRDHKTNFINWEVLQAFNMNQMHRDIFNIQEKLRLAERSMKTPDHSEIRKVLGDSQHLQPLLHLAQKTLTPILIVEGIIIFEDSKIHKLCDLMYFIEIEKESCKTRRRDRVWDPEGSSWVEDPQYFETIAWPQYIKSVERIKSSIFDVKFLDSTRTSIEDNFGLVIEDIIDKTTQ